MLKTTLFGEISGRKAILFLIIITAKMTDPERSIPFRTCSQIAAFRCLHLGPLELPGEV